MAKVGEKHAGDGTKRSNLRSGYTTGACATAAAKAAVKALCTQEMVDEIDITLPLGQVVRFAVASCAIEAKRAICSVVKDAGDDPDVTNGAEIGAIVEWSDEIGVCIYGGEGVGVVTKPGLGLEIGSPAINPVPREMIMCAVNEVLTDPNICLDAISERSEESQQSIFPNKAKDRSETSRDVTTSRGTGNLGVKVTIFVLNGEQLAKKTLNARLGIIGGISILGTTGIVAPYSTSAYKACIVQALNVARANSCQHVVLTTGRRSEKFAQKLLKLESLNLPEEAFIQVADFSGFAIRQCAAKRFHTVTFFGMVGKLSKIAAGATQTHVDSSRMDHDFLAKLAVEAGLPTGAVAAIRDGNTAREFAEIVAEHDATTIFSRICDLAVQKLMETAGLNICKGDSQSPSAGDQAVDSMEIQCIMSDFDGNVIGRAVARGTRPDHRSQR